MEGPTEVITENDFTKSMDPIEYEKEQIKKIKEMEKMERKERRHKKKKEKTLAEIENDVKKKWEEIKNFPKEDVDVAEKFFSENSTILYVPTSIKCEGIDDIIRVHSYKNHCGISTKDLSNEVIINTTVCGNTITEEKILTILHTRPIQWLLPGVQATGRRIVLPIVTIVAFDDDLLIKSKRLYWDQACVLKQVGLIPMISRCPFNGEDTEVPAKGVQQSDPLLSKEQLEDINSLDILNRYSLRQASIERFKSLKSDYVNKNKGDSVKKLFEEKGRGVEEKTFSDGRRRSYQTNDFRSKSDTLSGFVTGDFKEEDTSDRISSHRSYNNDSKNIKEILSENCTEGGSIHDSISTRGSRRMYKERLYQYDNVFSPSNKSDESTVFSGKRIFAGKNKDNVKISMEDSDSEIDCPYNYSAMYDIDSNLDGKWETNSHSVETLDGAGGYDQQTDYITEQMKNLDLKNNYTGDEISEKSSRSSSTSSVAKKQEKSPKKVRRQRVPYMAPHFVSNITFDNYGSQDINDRPKYRRRRKMVPQARSTFKMAYDKEELEKDNLNRAKKPISPTYISHVFDQDEVVHRVRPIRKNDIFYESIYFNDFSNNTSQADIKPPLVVKDKFISNIFNKSSTEELYTRHSKSSPDPRNQITYSNIHFDGSGDEEGEDEEEERVVRRPVMEDHMNKIFSEPSEDHLVHPVVNPIPKNCINYTTFNFDDPPEQTVVTSEKPKDKFVSHIFRGDSLDDSNFPVTDVNGEINERSDIYNVMYGGGGNANFFKVDPPRGIKTYKQVDHIKEILRGTNEKINFNDIRMINSIHNSMHSRSVDSQRV